MTAEGMARLNKHLALALGISRREADLLIEKRQVTINGKTAELGSRLLSTDTVVVKGRRLTGELAHQYLLFYKPIGYVCSRRPQGDNPTIYALLPKKYHHLKPVGRLDRDTSGVLLLTNDGDFAYRMTHPKFRKVKQYLVTLDHDLEPLHQQMISDYGIQLQDGPSKLMLQRESDNNRHVWRVTMSEGRNRQIRRTFIALGYEIKKLHRTHFGQYTLEHLHPGEYKTTTPKD